MDLHLLAERPTAEERQAVDGVLGAPPARGPMDGHVAYGGRAAREQRHLLLPALHAVQDRVGWVSRGGLGYVCERLSIPPAEAYGVLSFYELLRTEPSPPEVAYVCDDLACRLSGADRTAGRLRDALGPDAAVHTVGCLGRCERAPAVLRLRSGPEPSSSVEAVGTTHVGGTPPLRLLRRVSVVDPSSLESFREHGGYRALRRAIEIGPQGVIDELTASRLVGRGGAAFPTGVKWQAVAEAPATPRYVVANADESEPGTFKDRVLLEGDPFATVEAMTIAGFAVGAEQGVLYVRGEYREAESRVRDAVDLARRGGFLGPDVLGAGFAFDVEVRRGAGAYIAGEETALFNSIEGHRPEPRNKPPYPVTHGLFGRPTLVNNVETLANVLEVLTMGGEAFAATGTDGSTGTRLFCVSGSVARPGVYEVEFGATLRDVLDLAGGATGGPLRCVLLGGAAGSFVAPDDLDVPLTFEGVRGIGATLGSGVVMAFDGSVDMADVVSRIARFFRHESCGQCVPCRVGTVRQEEALHRLVAGHPLGSEDEERARLADVGAVMRDASICGLGQTAATAVASALRLGLVGGRGPG